MKLALHGATGRMGRTIARLAHEAGDVQIVGAICHDADPCCGKDLGELAGVGVLGVEVTSDVDAGLLGAEVVIDFSLPPALGSLLRYASKRGVALVSGTTGFTPEQERQLEHAAQTLPLLYARNMSLGIQVLAELVTAAATKLGPDFDIEIVEIHHRKKIDSPSGTAKRLADAVSEARTSAKHLYSREGQVGARTNEEVGVFGVRGGDVPGDHTVYMFGQGERIELTHRAGNRDVFAAGAIRAARWMRGRPPGLYSIKDVLSGG